MLPVRAHGPDANTSTVQYSGGSPCALHSSFWPAIRTQVHRAELAFPEQFCNGLPDRLDHSLAMRQPPAIGVYSKGG